MRIFNDFLSWGPWIWGFISTIGIWYNYCGSSCHIVLSSYPCTRIIIIYFVITTIHFSFRSKIRQIGDKNFNVRTYKKIPIGASDKARKYNILGRCCPIYQRPHLSALQTKKNCLKIDIKFL